MKKIKILVIIVLAIIRVVLGAKAGCFIVLPQYMMIS